MVRLVKLWEPGVNRELTGGPKGKLLVVLPEFRRNQQHYWPICLAPSLKCYRISRLIATSFGKGTWDGIVTQ